MVKDQEQLDMIGKILAVINVLIASPLLLVPRLAKKVDQIYLELGANINGFARFITHYPYFSYIIVLVSYYLCYLAWTNKVSKQFFTILIVWALFSCVVVESVRPSLILPLTNISHY